MKKLTKLGIKKVTLRNLDDPTLNKIAGGIETNVDYSYCVQDTCNPTCRNTCYSCGIIKCL